MAKTWWGNDYKAMLNDCEARLTAALEENNRLRNENEKLRKATARPNVVMVGGDDGEVNYSMSDGGW